MKDDTVWRGFLQQFQLEPTELERLALFLLAHAQLDRWLIHATAIRTFTARAEQWGAAIPDADNELDRLVSQHAKGTFGDHMNRAKQAGLLGGHTDICDEVNNVRNRFLHWEPGRFKVPTYQGEAVTTESGFHRCLFDIDKVIVGLKAFIDEA